MTTSTSRQYRGLLLAWRTRPEHLKQPPSTTNIPTEGDDTSDQTLTHNAYRRFALPTFSPITGKGAYRALAGRCRWCKQPVDEPTHRVWHADCLPAYWAATGNQSALVIHISEQHREQDGDLGTACEECNLCTTVHWNYITDRFPEHESYLWFHKLGMDWTVTPRQTAGGSMELDHRDALSVAWASGSQRRLIRALTLPNLRWLCHQCHATKTGQDRRRMRNLLEGRPEEWTPPLSKRQRIDLLQMPFPNLTTPNAPSP